MRIKFIQKIIDKIRKKGIIPKYILENNNINISEKNSGKVYLSITGINNTVIIEENSLSQNAHIGIILHGDNNTIKIGKGFLLSNGLIMEIGRNHPAYGKVENCRVTIGENTSIESCTITMVNSNSYVDIGKDCMFANDVNLYNTDTHPVFDYTSKKIINRVKGITIGNHCWIGRNVTILKNSEIANDCICGWGAVVSGKFSEEHCAIAGNPARIVKRNVTWAPQADGYVSQEESV